MEGARELKNTIEKLKEIDRKVDLARSDVQLEVLLGMDYGRTISISELAGKVKSDRRAIIDAIQKLKAKGLVDIRRKGEYVLTPEGKNLRDDLLSLAGTGVYKSFQAIRVLLVMTIAGTKELKIREGKKVYKELRPVWLSLKEISSLSNLPVEEVKGILDKHLRGYVVKKTLDEELVDYRLTERGLEVAGNILGELGYSLFTAKVFSIITGTPDPFVATKRYFTLYALLTLFTILTAPLYPWHLIPSLLWLVITIYTAALLAISFKM